MEKSFVLTSAFALFRRASSQADSSTSPARAGSAKAAQPSTPVTSENPHTSTNIVQHMELSDAAIPFGQVIVRP